MHSFNDTVHPLHKRPGRYGTDGVRLFVSARPISSTDQIDVHCIAISNDQFDAYESDLSMT